MPRYKPEQFDQLSTYTLVQKSLHINKTRNCIMKINLSNQSSIIKAHKYLSLLFISLDENVLSINRQGLEIAFVKTKKELISRSCVV